MARRVPRPAANFTHRPTLLMLFNSLTFLVFFAIVFPLFFLLRTWRAQKALLLIASYVFYAAWSAPYVVLLLLSTLVDWWLAKRIFLQRDAHRRRLLLVLSLACNLGLLGYFKYGNFVVENFQAALALAGLPVPAGSPGIVLPIAISFYTFASLSYTIDVYRREIAADASFVDYALFVGFFPHLVAGPILRASGLLPQIATPRQPSRDDIGWGLTLVFLGLFAKVGLADSVMAPVVNEVYAAPAKHGAQEIVTALLSFSGQIYFDFCGYSLCAIGLARCFGFTFPDNFRFPYAARGFSDFWRRWHISLSSWLRDYLYISIGGNRGSWTIYRNLMVTMLIAGLWHGASWMFVLWGGVHGLLLVLERVVRRYWPALVATLKKGLLPEAITFLTVTLAWIPFRAPTADAAQAILAGLVRLPDAYVPDQAELMAIAVIALTLAGNLFLRDRDFRSTFESLHPGMRLAMVSGCMIGLFMFSGGAQHSFIYFQF